MKFDEVLHEAGEFGVYQKRLLLLVCVTGGCVIIQNLSPVFTMAVPLHRCQIPGYPNDSYEVQNEQHARLINLTIPLTEKGDYSRCMVYNVTAQSEAGSENEVNRTEHDCQRWVYDKSVFTETLSSQLDLVCDNKIYRSHTSMMIFAGKFLGAFLNSICGDYFGRRRVYTVMMLAMLASVVGLVFVNSLPALMALRFIVGGTTTGSYLCTYVIGMELMGKSQRRFISIAFKSCEIVMTLMATLSAYFLRDWSHFQASLAAPCLLVLIGYFFIPESPRWLMSKGRVKEAQKIMEKIARVNGVQISSRLLQAVDDTEMSAPRSAVSPLKLFRVSRLFVRLQPAFSVLYGLMLNVSNMSGNIFINFTFMAAVDVLSLCTYVLLIERIGRRPLLVSVMSIGGLACLATILPTILGGSSWILRGLSMIGRMCTATGLMSIYVMSPELFPTVLRSFGLGCCSMLARIGGLASPYVADLNTYVSGVWGPALPQVVFGVAGLLTAVLVLMLPETKGRQLPENIHDAVVFGRQQASMPHIQMIKLPREEKSEH